MFVRVLIELFVGLGLMVGFITQIGVPYVQGKPFFPLFRRKSEIEERIVSLEKELAEEKEKTRLANLQQKVNQAFIERVSDKTTVAHRKTEKRKATE